jgi:hypothetical protein
VARALKEIHRVLLTPGYLVIRNGTKECNEQITWGNCFTEALAIEDGFLPTRKGLAELVCKFGFRPVWQETIPQYCAPSYEEYFEKIRMRCFSSLIAMSDEAFETGLVRLKNSIVTQPRDAAVYEPVDHFMFGK